MNAFDGFDTFMTDVMQKWDVPGMSVVVVKDDEVIYQQGFGYRDAENQTPVTPDTIFAIGSSSKAFTGMALAILVDDGLLDLNKPIRDYMPDFELMDKFATERMTALDLVTHRSGLPRHDLMWYNTPYTRKELFHKLKYLEPSKDFRTFLQYQNLMFMTAGYLIEVISCKTWEDFIQERIFSPLGMTSTNTSVNISQKSADYAFPYEKNTDKERRQIPFRNIDVIGPAGSINSNAVDMAQWLRVNLNKGKIGDTQLVSEDMMTEMQARQMPIVPKAMMFPFLDQHPEVGQASYGMGWFVQNYRGTKWVHHGGSIDGFIAQVALLPQENIGVICLSNLGGELVPVVVGCNVFDRLLGKEPIDWTTTYKEFSDTMQGGVEEANKQILGARHPDTTPSHELADYAGEFEHPGYGTVTVTYKNDTLTSQYNNIESHLDHLHYDIFTLDSDLIPIKFPVSFITDTDGSISQLEIQWEQAVKPIVFRRVLVQK